MSFRTSAEAKTYAVEATSRRRTHDESLRWLRDLYAHLSRESDQRVRGVWREQIDSLEAWLASEAYKAGDYPQGIDELVLELIEWRALQHAFQSVETNKKPFRDHVFYQQWLIGSIYAVFSLLGKLTGNAKREASLLKVWQKVESWISSDGACAKAELNFIKTRLSGPAPRFTNRHSRAILFRNSVIAHNEKSLAIAWGEIDEDVRTLVRIWAIVVSWSSFGLLSPFRSADVAFSGLETVYDANELTLLKSKRQEYIDRTVEWMETHLHNGERDPGRGPFACVSVGITMFPPQQTEG
jgi:hypothetical protein